MHGLLSCLLSSFWFWCLSIFQCVGRRTGENGLAQEMMANKPPVSSSVQVGQQRRTLAGLADQI